jgi:hypothetical protein
MAFEAGFANIATLKYEGDKFPAIWEYLRGERQAFVAAQHDVKLDKIFGNISPKHYLHPHVDYEKYGRFPEKRGIVRQDESEWPLTHLWWRLRRLTQRAHRS